MRMRNTSDFLVFQQGTFDRVVQVEKKENKPSKPCCASKDKEELRRLKGLLLHRTHRATCIISSLPLIWFQYQHTITLLDPVTHPQNKE